MLIHRYLTAYLLKSFCAALAILSGVMIIAQWIQMGSFLTFRDVDLILLALVPMGRYVIPMSLLFSILLVLERLSSDSEIIAMQSCAVKRSSIYRPALEFAVLCMLVNLAISTYLGPLSMQRIQSRLLEAAPNRIYAFLKERTFDETFKGMSIYVESVNPAKRRIKNIFIENKGQDRYVVTAARGTIEVTPAQVMMKLVNGSLFTQKGPLVRFLTFDEYTFSLDINLRRKLGIRNWEIATQPELKAMIAKEPQVKSIKEYHNRYAFPVLSLILGLIGVSFGVQAPRSPKFTGFLIGVGTIFGYYLVFTLADRMVKAGHLAPIMGAWLPNILACLILAVVWLFRRTRFSRA